MLAFHPFQTPNTSIDVALLLYEQIEKWLLGTKIMSINTENPSDIKNVISQLHVSLKNSYPFSYTILGPSYVQWVSHVINRSVKEGMNIMHWDMGEVRSLVDAVRASTKQRE